MDAPTSEKAAMNQTSPQLVLMRRAILNALSESLRDEQAKAAFLASADGEPTSAQLKHKLEEIYDSFGTLVTRLVEHDIDQWCTQYQLDARFNSLSAAQPEGSLGVSEIELKTTADRVSAKRAEVQRLTETIKKEETKSAHMRVELARQEAAARAAQNKLREAKLV